VPRRYQESDTIVHAEILNLPFFGRGEVGNMIMFYKTMLVSSRTLHEMITFQTNRKYFTGALANL
jgi:hypothetical protein